MFKKRARPQSVVVLDSAAAAAASVGEAAPPESEKPDPEQVKPRTPPQPPAEAPGKPPKAAESPVVAAALTSEREEREEGTQPSGQPNDAARTLICKMWAEKGVCKYGDGCQFAHVFDPTKVRGVAKLGKEVDSWKESLAFAGIQSSSSKEGKSSAPKPLRER